MNYLKNLHDIATEEAMNEARKKNPGLPDWKLKQLIKVPEYSDKNKSALTAAILDFMKFSAWKAERVKDSARYKDGSPVICCDIIATVHGLRVHIEVQVNDGYFRKKWAVEKYKQRVRDEKGLYMRVSSFADFIEQYERLLIIAKPNSAN